MHRAAAAIAGLSGWRRRAVAVLAGAASVLALAPFFLWYLLFITIPVLVWLIDGACAGEARASRRARAAADIGWCFGFGYLLAGLYWIGHSFLVEADVFAWLLPLPVLGLPAALALFYAAGAALAGVLWRPGPARVIALTLGVALAEIARGTLFTGLPWNTLGYAVTATDAMMQWASLFGVYGLTFLAVALFGAPAAIIEPGRRVVLAGRLYALIVIAIFAGGWVWGIERLGDAQAGTVDGVRLRVVQPNIPQREKWVPENAPRVFRTYLEASRTGPGETGGGTPLDGITHVVWPESALPFLLADTTEALAAIADLLPDGTRLITGQARAEDVTGADGKVAGRDVYNSIFVMNDRAQITNVYDKVHLVPFGEYLPFQSVLEAVGLEQLTRVRGGFTPGTGKRYVEAPGTPPFIPLICYEVLFPHHIRPEGARPQWLLNVTNDAWFGDSIGPYQHLHQARVRAVEQGLPLVRAANTGMSAVIDGYGRIVASLPLGERGTIDVQLPRALAPTGFLRAGYLVELVLALIFAAGWAVFGWATKRNE